MGIFCIFSHLWILRCWKFEFVNVFIKIRLYLNFMEFEKMYTEKLFNFQWITRCKEFKSGNGHIFFDLNVLDFEKFTLKHCLTFGVVKIEKAFVFESFNVYWMFKFEKHSKYCIIRNLNFDSKTWIARVHWCVNVHIFFTKKLIWRGSHLWICKYCGEFFFGISIQTVYGFECIKIKKKFISMNWLISKSWRSS